MWTAQKISLQFGSAFFNLYIVVVVIPSCSCLLFQVSESWFFIHSSWSVYVRKEIFFILTTRRQANQVMVCHFLTWSFTNRPLIDFISWHYRFPKSPDLYDAPGSCLSKNFLGPYQVLLCNRQNNFWLWTFLSCMSAFLSVRSVVGQYWILAIYSFVGIQHNGSYKAVSVTAPGNLSPSVHHSYVHEVHDGGARFSLFEFVRCFPIERFVPERLHGTQPDPTSPPVICSSFLNL